jgi:ferredoxin
VSGLLRISATGCMGHGRCYAVAPDLVHDDEEGFNAERGTDVVVPDGFEDQAAAAADACPEMAIEYLEDSSAEASAR